MGAIFTGKRGAEMLLFYYKYYCTQQRAVMTGIIYCIHCISTGEKYIGQTRRSLETRLRYHRYDAPKENNKAKLYLKIKETGWENFIVGIAEECDVEILNERECYYIEKFNSLEEGLNSSPGGGKFPIMKGKCHPLFGKGHNAETKLKISKNHHNVLGQKNPRSNYYEVEFLDGKKEIIYCLTEWGRNNGYKKQNLFNLACNLQKSPHKDILKITKIQNES